MQETRTLLDESEGVQRSIVDTPTPKHLRRAPVPMKRLKGVSGQITEIQGWLRTHPDLLLVFDEALHREFRRTNLIALLMNVFFTLAGAMLGYLLPLMPHWFSWLR